MGDKKFWWWKMPMNYFSTEEIRWLREQKNGNEQCIIYQQLCLMTLNTNGVLLRTVGEMKLPYSYDRLAEMIGSKPAVIKTTITNLKKIGFVVDNGENGLFFTQVPSMTGSAVDSKNANKKRKQRDSLGDTLGDKMSPKEGTKCPPKRGQNVPLEIRDKSIELRDIYPPNPPGGKAHADAYEKWDIKVSPLTESTARQIQLLVAEYGDDIVQQAIDKVTPQTYSPLKFVQAVARRISAKGAQDDSLLEAYEKIYGGDGDADGTGYGVCVNPACESGKEDAQA